MSETPRLHRAWCFTVNNPPMGWYLPETDRSGRAFIRYAVYQYEIASTGTEHIQGYVEYTRAITFENARKRIDAPDRRMIYTPCHVEPRQGTPTQARAYCMKDDTRKPGTSPVEIGTFNTTSQGTRSDIEQIHSMIKQGKRPIEIFEEHPATIRMWKNVTSICKLYEPKRDWVPEVHVFWGAPGTGKTKAARAINPESTYMVPAHDNTLWFDNYQGQEVMVFDDYYGGMKWTMLLRICDRYDMQLPSKGGHVEMLAKHIVFTSNVPWTEWYKNVPDTAAFARRVTDEKHFT